MKNKLNEIRKRRQNRVRAKISGTALKPRLSIFRSNKSIYVQMIDDEKGRTVVSASAKELNRKSGGKQPASKSVGILLAEKAKKAGIKNAVVDRSHYRYHGRVKALVEGAKEGGLIL